MPALASLAAALAILLLASAPAGGRGVQAAGATPPLPAERAPHNGGVLEPGTPTAPRAPAGVVTTTPGTPLIEPVAFEPPADAGTLGIPAIVLAAYQRAAGRLAIEQAGCHLQWWLLAGIGQVESGQAEGGRVYPDGTTRGTILGPVLDGHIPGDAIVRDTDGGRLDGNTQFDRAVGPMQFIPSTWATWGADGNGDGRKDPNNIFDAALAAARYLCADNRDLATPGGLTAAILSYNHSQAYLQTVLGWAEAYRSGSFSLPSSALPVISDVTAVRAPLPGLRAKPATRPAAKPLAASVGLRAGGAAPTTGETAEPTAVPSPTGSGGVTVSASASSSPTSAPASTQTSAQPTVPSSAPASSDPTPSACSASSTASPTPTSDPSVTADPSATVTADGSAIPSPTATADTIADPTADATVDATARPSGSASSATPTACPH